jgi:hypothetical protein
MASGSPVAVPGLEVNETNDGLIVYDPGLERVHYLNATASVIFMLSDGTRDVRRIADAVGQAYDADRAPVAEVETCLSQLRNEGLVR